MRATKRSLAILCAMGLAFTACKKDAQLKTDEISSEVKAQIAKMGLDANWVTKANGGYMVEGDIFIPENRLGETGSAPTLRVADEEQYRTFNLVNGLPRVITVSVTNLPAVFAQATDTMIARYNAENLQLTFQRVQSGGVVDIVGFNEPPSGGFVTLGSAGFPTSAGDPYNQIKLNTNEAAYGTNPNLLYVASVLQHEMGHCIGFRHTDYMNRSYSCGGRRANEGQATNGIGAVHIPGTPTKGDPNSFMLACAGGGDRTFNANDKVALNYLY